VLLSKRRLTGKEQSPINFTLRKLCDLMFSAVGKRPNMGNIGQYRGSPTAENMRSQSLRGENNSVLS
jgi:hypothetical protein